MSHRLLVVCNDLEFFLLHRLPETQGALREGYEVHVATPPGERFREIRELGFVHHDLTLSRSGLNPLCELASILAFYRLFRHVKPDLLYLMTVKPILYGGIAARLAGVKAVVAAVFGMGFLFTNNGFGTRMLRTLVLKVYYFALDQRNIRVIFQNPTDQQLMIDMGVVCFQNTRLIQGSGVDLGKFEVKPEPDGIPTVLMAARLLYDKGVVEFIEAARLLRQQGVHARFLLAGDVDAGNPSSVTRRDVEIWKLNGDVEFLGFRKDMPNLLIGASVVVLPSYREGLPRVLEEAAACGRPVVTTDVPGCRDAVEPGVTGLLVPAKDALKLAQAISKLVQDKSLRRQMGAYGRQLAESKYSIEHIVNAHLALYHEMLGDE
jgi:glycosyltransferase involved in cell wall biosynthesis